MTDHPPERAKRPVRPFNGVRQANKRAFLTAYARLGGISRAAEAAGIDRTNHSLWMAKDPVYADAFAVAREIAIDRLEAEADRRGIEGVERDVWYKGEKVGTELHYSDVLLIFRLKALRPEVYRERVDVRGQVNSTVTHELGPDAKAAIMGRIDQMGANLAATRDILGPAGLLAPEVVDVEVVEDGSTNGQGG